MARGERERVLILGERGGRNLGRGRRLLRPRRGRLARLDLGCLSQGAVVFVPVPFTDLSGGKRRPALVVSPGDAGFDGEDLILCAITSRVPRTLSEWEVLLEADDLMGEKLPRKSMVKVGKLFTMHRGLVAARYGIVKDQKLREVLARLRRLFALEDPAKERNPSYPG